MAWQPVKCGGTDYLVDWSVVERFVRNYWRTKYQQQYSSVVKMSESSWYNPLSWSLPEIATLDVPWDDVRVWTERAVRSDMANYLDGAKNNMRDIAYDVQWKMQQIPVNVRAFRSDLRDVERRNLVAIDAAVDSYTGLIETAKFIRDTSADVVAIGSTIATGGAATALLGASAALKGGFKYQDTSSVGAAVLYGTGSALLGMFKVGGKALTKTGEYVLIVCSGGLESGVSLAAGDTFGKAVETGTLKIASMGVAQAVFGNALVKKLFARIPLPFTVFAKTGEYPSDPKMLIDEGSQFALKAAKKLTEKTTKIVLRGGLNGAKETPAGSDGQGEGGGGGLADDVPFEDQLLLYLAIVNMSNGIGRGW